MGMVAMCERKLYEYVGLLTGYLFKRISWELGCGVISIRLDIAFGPHDDREQTLYLVQDLTR